MDGACRSDLVCILHFISHILLGGLVFVADVLLSELIFVAVIMLCGLFVVGGFGSGVV